MVRFLTVYIIGLMLFANKPAELKILLFNKSKVWKDSSDMNFKIKLLNQSSETKLIFDQVLDDVYNYHPSSIDNLTFITQRLIKGQYTSFRDRAFVDYFPNESSSPK